MAQGRGAELPPPSLRATLAAPPGGRGLGHVWCLRGQVRDVCPDHILLRERPRGCEAGSRWWGSELTGLEEAPG